MRIRLAIVTLFALGLFLSDMGSQPAWAQQRERLIGGGRIMRKIFGIDSPSSQSAKDKAPKPKSSKTGKTPTLAKQPTLAKKPKAKPKSDPFTSNRKVANTPADASPIPKPATRSNPQATTGFGMLVELRGENLAVRQLAPKGNAAEAGIKRGDIIRSGGGVDFKNVDEFNQIAEILKDGDQLEFEIERRGKEEKVLIQFGDAPEPPEVAENDEAPGPARNNGNASNDSLNNQLQVNSKKHYSFLPTNQERRQQDAARAKTNSNTGANSNTGGMQSVIGNVFEGKSNNTTQRRQSIQPLNPTASPRTTAGSPSKSETLRRQLQLQRLEIERLRQELKRAKSQTNDFQPVPSLQGPGK